MCREADPSAPHAHRCLWVGDPRASLSWATSFCARTSRERPAPHIPHAPHSFADNVPSLLSALSKLRQRHHGVRGCLYAHSGALVDHCQCCRVYTYNDNTGAASVSLAPSSPGGNGNGALPAG